MLKLPEFLMQLAWKKVDKAQALYTAGCEKLAETSNELDILRHQVRLLHDTIISKTNELGEAKTKVTDYAVRVGGNAAVECSFLNKVFTYAICI